MSEVTKEFCDERSQNIIQDISEIKDHVKSVRGTIDKMLWLLVTTLAGMVSTLVVESSKACAPLKVALKELVLRYFG